METIKIDFEIVLQPHVSERIEWLTHNYDKEISAWLTGELKDNQVIIDGLLFPHQEVGSASVDTDTKQLIKLRKEYGDECKRIIGHWHSHNTMGAFFSGTDDKFMEEHTNGRELRVFLVTSTHGNKARLEMRKPFRLSINDINIIQKKDNPQLEEEMNALIKEKVTESKTGTVVVSNIYEEAYEPLSLGEVKIDKKTHNVKIDDLTTDMYTKLEGIIEYDIEYERHKPNDRIDVVFKVGDKQRARRLRDQLNTILGAAEAENFRNNKGYQEALDFYNQQNYHGGGYGFY